MAIETDPPGFRIVPSCSCPTATKGMHVIRDTEKGAVRIDWHQSRDTVHDMRCCLRCAMPLRVEPVA